MPADNVQHDVDSDAEQEDDTTQEPGHDTIGEDGLVPDCQAQATPAEDIVDGSGEDTQSAKNPVMMSQVLSKMMMDNNHAEAPDRDKNLTG